MTRRFGVSWVPCSKQGTGGFGSTVVVLLAVVEVLQNHENSMHKQFIKWMFSSGPGKTEMIF